MWQIVQMVFYSKWALICLNLRQCESGTVAHLWRGQIVYSPKVEIQYGHMAQTPEERRRLHLFSMETVKQAHV